MKAIYRDRYGPPDVLALKDVEKPEPRYNQVLIKVHAASVNPMDWHVLRGEPFLVRLMGFGVRSPKHLVIGADMAGRVEAVGEDVTQFKVGDEVFGSGMGAFAEYACIQEDAVVLKPRDVTFEQAAAVPIAGLTALQALRDQGHVQEGQHVLINGASGGVGTFAVQIAKVLGAEVTGVCSTKNVELVRSLGADHVVDYTKENFWDGDKQYDVITDTAAFYSISKPLRALKSTGIYVGIGGSSSTGAVLRSLVFNPILAKMKGREVVTFIASVVQDDLVYLKGLMEAGKVQAVVDRTYTLGEVPEAIRYVEEGHTRGKVVIVV